VRVSNDRPDVLDNAIIEFFSAPRTCDAALTPRVATP